MKNQEQKSTLRRFFRSRLFLVTTGLALFLISFSLIRAYYEDYQVNQKIQELSGQVRSLEGKKLKSLQVLEYVASNNFIEEKAKLELNLRKPGENVIFVEGITVASSSSAVPTATEPVLSNPLKWWHYFTSN